MTAAEHAPAAQLSGTPPPQLDYRANPNLGHPRDPAGGAQTYGTSIDAAATSVQPPIDETWKSYDATTDATRFNGINNADQQAALLYGDRPGGWNHR